MYKGRHPADHIRNALVWQNNSSRHNQSNNVRVADCIFNTSYIQATYPCFHTPTVYRIISQYPFIKVVNQTRSLSVISHNRSPNKCTQDLSVMTHLSCKVQVNLCSPHAKQDAKPTGHKRLSMLWCHLPEDAGLERWLYSSERRLTACRNKGNGSEAIALLISMERHIMRHPTNNTF